ncbi:MAG: NUDIX hydrolase [Candidatus Thorarchaeota archaeon]|nr:MAG: NUDIX hydrolase [Candidatus Thorarchaeota archaeon]
MQSDADLEWKQVEERVVFRSPFLGLRNDLVKRPDGEVVEYIVVEYQDYSSATCVVEDDTKVVLVRQFRYPWLQASWESPSGLIHSSESAEEAAIRETKEETGYSIRSIQPLARYHPTGLGPVWCNLYYATVGNVSNQLPDPSEFLRVGLFSFDEVDRMIEDGKIVHAATIMGWSLARLRGLV